MNPSAPVPDDALLDLLVKRVTEGLSTAEQRELDVLDDGELSEQERALELAAAAVALTAARGAPPLPASLRERIERDARTVVALRPPGPPARRPWPAAAGWFAAAACLILAVAGWLRQPASAPATTPPLAQETRLPVHTPAQARAALLARAGTLKAAFGKTADPGSAGVSGDVVWDPATQQGYLRFSGLASNDPSVNQYQLWIFDGGRDSRYPVDGGVFDVPKGGGEVVIPIRAALAVRAAKAFAVTVEKPGGVVVSGREHVVALAQVG